MLTEHSRTHTSWGAFLTRPAVFVGVVAAAAVAVAVAGAISGSISSYYQDRSEQAKLRTTALLELIKEPLANASNAANFPCVCGAERPALRPARA